MGRETIIVVGAGASGLMAACELGKAGRRVIVLEARDRIGGRIWPLSLEDFGIPAQAGAEFVHGDAPVTKSLVAAAGMTLIETHGDMWSSRDRNFTINDQVIPDQDLLHEKLRALDHDMSISEFLEKNFPGEQYDLLHKAIIEMVKGFDAANPSSQALSLSHRSRKSFTPHQKWDLAE
ncbi:FAD-dependent oxidoreductase [Candidatus Kaiserbacteria bacterium]|nr:FAD-dependent oxidoreductase [Candidatus Kaiserbacteria bacterium]